MPQITWEGWKEMPGWETYRGSFSRPKRAERIISDACGGAITLGDQSFIVQAVPDDDCGVAAGQTRSLYLPCATEDACVLEA